MKYFNAIEVLEALKSGTATKYQISQNATMAKSRGYTSRAEMFREALALFKNWKEENEKE